MKTETIVLRQQPKLEFQFGETGFEVRNEVGGPTDTVYPYSRVDSVKWRDKKTNWLVTVLSYIVSLVFNTSSGDTYKDKQRLTVVTSEGATNFNLTGIDSEKVKAVLKKLDGKVKLIF